MEFHPDGGPENRFVYINDDGSARELTAGEREYLAAEYRFGDGNAPYIKSSYTERNGWGTLRGFLFRGALPREIPIAKAP